DHTPVVWRVKATVLPENRPPVVGDLVVLRPGEKLEKPGKTDATAPDGKKTPPDGARWISWKATDPDGDKLTHVLWIRMNGKKFQKHAEGITEPPFALRDEDLPEGRYQVRLEVDDSPSNGPTRALSTSSVSGPFLVDHTPPRLSVKRLETAGGRPGIEVRAIDGHGGWIDRAEYKVQGAGAKEDDWIRLPCRDGICDTANESFLLDPKRLASGRVMVIRVYDAAGNVTTVEAPPGT
ncbi:MAG: hypothetical protein ACE5HU_03950, partial [Acidobacteriota bacterium]